MMRGMVLAWMVGCGGGGSTCETFCDLAASCDLPNSGAECVLICEDDIEGATAFDRGCGRALEDRYRCVNQLTCDPFLDWLDETPAGDYPCIEAELDTDVACGG